MQITIEPTRNYRELTRLNKTVQTWHYDNFPNEFKPFDTAKIENEFKKMLQNEDVFAFIAKNQTDSVGYILGYVKVRPDSAFQYEKAVLYIDQIVVVQEYQNRGVGQQLMEKAYAFAKVKQITEVQLDFWTGNKLAESFFLKNGFAYFNHSMKK